MMPTNEDFRKASCVWRGEHHGISYELSWHGWSESRQNGTWCWYIIVTDQIFYPEDWAKLRLTQQDRQMGGGSWHRRWSYEEFPNIEPHCGWTFGEMTTFLGRDGIEHELVKVGCDYAHYWDEESGYWQGLTDIECDVKYSIDLLVGLFPKRRERCGYSGTYDDPDKFYAARNGSRVHISHVAHFKENEGWSLWLPADDISLAATTDGTITSGAVAEQTKVVVP